MEMAFFFEVVFRAPQPSLNPNPDPNPTPCEDLARKKRKKMVKSYLLGFRRSCVYRHNSRVLFLQLRDKYRGEQMRATACIVECSPPTAFVLFLAAQARKLSLSASLQWAGEALKRHARDIDGDAAIQVLSFSSVF